MSVSVNLERIKQLGIDLWYPHGLRHPIYKNRGVSIYTPFPVVMAGCLVVRFFARREDLELSEQVQKIYQGMLGVLELGSIGSVEQQIMELCVVGAEVDLVLVAQEVLRWQPCAVLQFGAERHELVVDVPLVRTFSPEHLAACNQDKAQAYKDLLKLRKIISGRRAYNT